MVMQLVFGKPVADPTAAAAVRLGKPCWWSAPLFILKVPKPAPIVTEPIVNIISNLLTVADPNAADAV